MDESLEQTKAAEEGRLTHFSKIKVETVNSQVLAVKS